MTDACVFDCSEQRGFLQSGRSTRALCFSLLSLYLCSIYICRLFCFCCLFLSVFYLFSLLSLSFSLFSLSLILSCFLVPLGTVETDGASRNDSPLFSRQTLLSSPSESILTQALVIRSCIAVQTLFSAQVTRQSTYECMMLNSIMLCKSGDSWCNLCSSHQPRHVKSKHHYKPNSSGRYAGAAFLSSFPFFLRTTPHSHAFIVFDQASPIDYSSQLQAKCNSTYVYYYLYFLNICLHFCFFF